MARRPHPKKLLVEGDEDKRVVPELIEAHGIPWGENSDEWIVEISQCDGFENVVKPGAIETELKVSGREALGIIADANSDAERRWESVRNRCLRSFPDLPKDLPAGGLIHENAEGLKLGVWLMPDNQSRGMMETFLTYLVPDHGDVLLGHAESACDGARALGAPSSCLCRTVRTFAGCSMALPLDVGEPISSGRQSRQVSYLDHALRTRSAGIPPAVRRTAFQQPLRQVSYLDRALRAS